MNLEAAYKKAIKRYGPDATAHLMNLKSGPYFAVSLKKQCEHCDGNGEITLVHGASRDSFEDAFKDADRREALEKTSKS